MSPGVVQLRSPHVFPNLFCQVSSILALSRCPRPSARIQRSSVEQEHQCDLLYKRILPMIALPCLPCLSISESEVRWETHTHTQTHKIYSRSSSCRRHVFPRCLLSRNTKNTGLTEILFLLVAASHPSMFVCCAFFASGFCFACNQKFPVCLPPHRTVPGGVWRTNQLV